jgi:hypothetical protein
MEELKMTSVILTSISGSLELPLTKMGKTTGGCGEGRSKVYYCT